MKTVSQKNEALSEEGIRPAKLMADKQKLVDADRGYLLSRKAEWVEAKCPACSSEKEEEAHRKQGYSYSRCLECGTVYTNPRPSPAVLRDFYAGSENYAYWNRHIFPATEEVRRERIFRPRAERVAAYCASLGVRTGTLLEVGAGFGTFCEEMRRLALFDRIVAVEPTPDLAASCRDRGLEVLARPIEEISGEVQADVIASFEVIEHLFCPEDFIRACVRRLCAGGLLVLTCPNVLGFDVSTLGILSNTIDHEHLNYFHTKSLPLLLERCGLLVEEVSTPGRLDAELVRKQILNGSFSVENQPLLSTLLVDRWEELGGSFQEFLAGQGLSSHMWVVARKKETA